MSHRTHPPLRALASILLLVVTGVGSGCELLSLLGETEAEERCAELCAIEDACGLRTLEVCKQESCPDGVRLPSLADECLESSDDCAVLAACACGEGCAKLDTCTGSTDAACPQNCATLVEQEPERTYEENRCRIESDCADLATCTGTESALRTATAARRALDTAAGDRGAGAP